MADSKLFMIPFGASGDRAAIPDTVAPSGAVSWPQGFGPDYERDPATDPMAKRIPRDETNEYLYQITNAIKFLQLYGVPEWFADDGLGSPVSYPLGARVRHAGETWISVISGNSSTPGVSAGWKSARGGLLIKETIFDTPGSFTFTPDPRTSFVEFEAVGGGGAGGSAGVVGAGSNVACGGGGPGAYVKGRFPASGPVSGMVGAGGVPSPFSNGGAGGGTSLSGIFSAPGGGGGGAGEGVSSPRLNGSAGASANPSASSFVSVSFGGAGGAGISFSDSGIGAQGGSNPLGAGGGPRGLVSSGSTLGANGAGFGGGGGGAIALSLSGTQGPSLGGLGSKGVVILREFSEL